MREGGRRRKDIILNKLIDKDLERDEEVNSGENININLDNIIKKGPKETVKLEMPSMVKQKENENKLPYFNGFLGHPINKEATVKYILSIFLLLNLSIHSKNKCYISS